MYSQIEVILKRYGYEGIELNVPDIYLALRKENDEGYAVVTLDETGGSKLSEAQFHHISEQIRGYLQQRGCTYCRFLYLLVSNQDESARRLFKDYECFWRIVPSRGQLMVFERLDEAFMVLRKPLEEMLMQNATKEHSHRESGRSLRIPWCNVLLIVINIIVFLYTDFFAVFSGDSIVDAGALGWYQVVEEGEWYRLISSMFLHMDGEHIFNNMLVLGYIGSCVELEIGSVRYGILYIGSGILAGCTSMVYNMLQSDYVVSIGASGAVFGTVGAILYLVLFHKQRRTQYSIRQIAWMALFSLYGGFATQGVDNAAHVGGFVAGFLIVGLLTLFRSRIEIE